MRTALRLFAGLVGFLITAILGLALVVYVQYRRDDHPITIPAPRGPHPVGRILADWNDAARHRELMVFLWYPAPDSALGPHPEYIPGKWGELALRQMLPIPSRRLRAIRVNAIDNAPVAGDALPILVMLPGMGRIPADYTTLAEDLASHGYVVAGVTPTGSSRPVVFSDGRVDWGSEDVPVDPAQAQQLVDTWAGDASFALGRLERDGRFASHLDLARTGIFGHSFGGNVAAHVLSGDTRFSRGVNMDGSFFGDPIKLDKPFLILESNDSETLIDRTICDRDPAGCEVRTFPKALHMDFSDSAILPSRFPFPKSMLLLGDVDGQQFLYDISDDLRTFFARM